MNNVFTLRKYLSKNQISKNQNSQRMFLIRIISELFANIRRDIPILRTLLENNFAVF